MSRIKSVNNSQKNLISSIFLFLIIISVFSIILFSSFFSYLYNINYYDKKYQEYKIYDRFSRDLAINETKNIFGYLRYKNEIDRTFFNDKEESHLNDVREIIQRIYVIYFISLFVFWGILAYYYFLNKKRLIWFFSRALFYSGIFSIMILVLLSIFYFLFGFDSLFLSFHKLFFSGNYSFNPSFSNMKALFPDKFFLDIGISTLSMTLIKAFLLFISGFYLKKRTS